MVLQFAQGASPVIHSPQDNGLCCKGRYTEEDVDIRIAVLASFGITPSKMRRSIREHLSYVMRLADEGTLVEQYRFGYSLKICCCLCRVLCARSRSQRADGERERAMAARLCDEKPRGLKNPLGFDPVFFKVHPNSFFVERTNEHTLSSGVAVLRKRNLEKRPGRDNHVGLDIQNEGRCGTCLAESRRSTSERSRYGF